MRRLMTCIVPACILIVTCHSSAKLLTPSVEASMTLDELGRLLYPGTGTQDVNGHLPIGVEKSEIPNVGAAPPSAPIAGAPPAINVELRNIGTLPAIKLSDAVISAYNAHLVSRLMRENEILDERRTAIAWNRSVSNIVAVTVHVLVLLAMIAALIEFVFAYRLRLAGQSVATGTQVSVGKDQVAFKTALIGTGLLVLSLGFYAMFLLLVYPVVTMGG